MSHENLSRRALFLAGASASVVALPAVAAALPTPAAPVEAAVDLPDAVAPKTDDELIALGERLKAMMPRMAALKRKSHVLWEEARACLPDGWGRDSDHYRTFKERAAKNGYREICNVRDAAHDELQHFARAIFNSVELADIRWRFCRIFCHDVAIGFTAEFNGTKRNKNRVPQEAGFPPATNRGSLAILAAIRRASSRVSKLAAARRPGSFSR